MWQTIHFLNPCGDLINLSLFSSKSDHLENLTPVQKVNDLFIFCPLSRKRNIIRISCDWLFYSLGSVHKYFGGGAGQLKIFVIKLFWPPFASHQNFLNPPLNMCENFFDPPLLHVKYQCLSPTPIYFVCTTGVPVLLVTLNWYCKAFLHGQTCSQVFQL